MKKLIICVFLLILLCSCGEVPTISGDVGSDDTQNDLPPENLGILVNGNRISIHKDFDGEGYTLYIPSGADDIRWDADSDGFFVLNGERTAVGSDANIVLTLDSFHIGDATVKVMKSSGVATIFLMSDDGSMSLINSSSDHSYSSKGSFNLVSAEGRTMESCRLKRIRGRGNATWYGTEKKPYQIDLYSEKSLLGLVSSEKYLLLANYYDPSLLRNRFVLDLAENFDGYSPKGVPVDLYANGEYLGAYLLCEKIDIAENKIDIFDLERANKKLLELSGDEYCRGGSLTGAEKGSSKWVEFDEEPKDFSGGYLLEVDYPERYSEELCGFVTERGLPIVIKSPEVASRSQVEYIRNFVCDFEDALYSSDGYNEKGKHISDYANVDTFIFRYLIEEFALNIDGGISSFYIYKDRDENGGKLDFSCVWDYDCALGNYNLFADLTSPETLFAASSESRNNGTMPSWFNALLAIDGMTNAVGEFYVEAFRPALIPAADKIAFYGDELRASALMDSDLYKGFEKRKYYGADSGEDFDLALNYLSDFISKRIEFFDEHFGK